MKNLKIFGFAAVLALLSGCTHTEEVPVKNVPLFQDEVIALQNLKSRVLVYCFTSADYQADDCAKRFESKGFVRLRDIPKLPAEFDFLKGDTYPTRRWRKDELVPRW